MSEQPGEQVPPRTRHLRDVLGTSYRLIGYSAQVRRLDTLELPLYGKWCRRCEGIWFGLALEVTCPQCGNRKG